MNLISLTSCEKYLNVNCGVPFHLVYPNFVRGFVYNVLNDVQSCDKSVVMTG